MILRIYSRDHKAFFNYHENYSKELKNINIKGEIKRIIGKETWAENNNIAISSTNVKFSNEKGSMLRSLNNQPKYFQSICSPVKH